MENNSINQITITYMFDNQEMHHWWMPDGWDDVSSELMKKGRICSVKFCMDPGSLYKLVSL